MKLYRVCVAEDGKPLIVHVLQEHEGEEDKWLVGPDRRTRPETPKEAKYVHYLNATDELGAYTKARMLQKTSPRRRTS
jgi:hypothetical protein